MTNEQREAIDRLKKYIEEDDFYNIYKEIKEDEREGKIGGTHIVFCKAIDIALSLIKEQEEEIDKVLELIFQYGQIDGAHHKMWVIDQIVRILTKEKYKEWVKEYMYDEDTGEYYSWDKGIAP